MNTNYFNKKGIISELFVFMIFAFVIAVICVLYFYMGVTVENKLLNATVTTSGNWTQEVETHIGGVNTAYNTLPWLSFTLIIFMIVAIFIGSIGVNTHPVFFIAYIFVTIVAVVVAVPMSNAYETLYNDGTLHSTFTKFEMTNFVFANLPLVITVVGLVGGTIMVIRLIRGRQSGLIG